MVLCKCLPHSGRGTNLIKVVVDTLEEVSGVELHRLLPRLASIGRFDWSSFDVYALELLWTEAVALASVRGMMTLEF